MCRRQKAGRLAAIYHSPKHYGPIRFEDRSDTERRCAPAHSLPLRRRRIGLDNG